VLVGWCCGVVVKVGVDGRNRIGSRFKRYLYVAGLGLYIVSDGVEDVGR
jgi:hypothetical protein